MANNLNSYSFAIIAVQADKWLPCAMKGMNDG